MDSVRLLAEHTQHKRMKANAVRLHVYIMCFAGIFAFVYRCGRGFNLMPPLVKNFIQKIGKKQNAQQRKNGKIVI